MAPMIFGLSNMFAASTSIVTASSSDASFPVANAKTPEPYNPWRATNLAADQWIAIDRGAAGLMRYIALHRTNAATVRIQGSTVSNFSVLGYNVLHTLRRCPLNGRYQLGVWLPSDFTYRYVRYYIATGTTLLAESMNLAEAVPLVGSIWGGTPTFPIINPTFEVEWRAVYPTETKRPASEAWAETLWRGNQFARVKFGLRAQANYVRPFADDQLRSWMDLVRQIKEAGPVAWFANAGDSSLALVLHAPDVRENPWNQARLQRARSEVEFEEVMA